MKQVVVFLILILTLFSSCTKEDVTTNYECGIVTDIVTYYDTTNGTSVFYLELDNLGFRVDYLTYLRAELGKEMCLTQ